jgi:pyruvate/2-oxoglutarate/acetoin dehydrogenase E1 component/TPP-dependent pyruvate/acetoin dehydrogenase alpha subunit
LQQYLALSLRGKISYQISTKNNSEPMLEKSAVKDKKKKNGTIDEQYRQEVVNDYRICCISREASYMARKEVLTGKAKFGIIGDGKEVPQVAMARAFQKGDWRSGYYRDQTFMFALGLSTVEDFFAQLYADADNDPFSGGRQMNSHYATPTLDENGNWKNHLESYNVSADISSTGGQMARALGLALASKKYRESESLKTGTHFSNQGNEVTFCTIGDASTSEGVFWETMNAATVLKVPLAVSVWDDGYGISVPIDYQTTKKSISKALAGFQLDESGDGMEIYTAKAWDYPGLIDLYQKGIEKVRKTHTPALFHIQEVTQPQGHSTSGSHERYKSKERLQFENDYDCIRLMRNWMIETGLAKAEELDSIEKEAKQHVKEAKSRAWKAFSDPVKKATRDLQEILKPLLSDATIKEGIQGILNELDSQLKLNPLLGEVCAQARRAKYVALRSPDANLDALNDWLNTVEGQAQQRYHTHLYSASEHSALRVPVVPADFGDEPVRKNGYEILNAFFEHTLSTNPAFFAFGEDVGKIGDVNQGFAGLQDKFGEDRVFDTGIREWTIMGQAIGMAMRGLRPLAEIQYLDYLIYGLEPLTDDLATVQYRSAGIQKAPAIIRTRGHRLEGIWHAGSPLGMLINALRGIYVCVPRNMTQAAGMYNTLLQSDEPGLVIECLNGYRLKEYLPQNISEFTVPMGVPEVLQEGTDITLVTYGSCIRVAEEGIQLLESHGISVELIDAQTLLPFDLEHRIVESLKKTNRIVFMDEDVPGGATAYMMKEVLETQNGYHYLDSAPVTLSAKAHRPPYGSDGDYFTKPSPEDVFEVIYQLLREADPGRFAGSLSRFNP